MDAVIDAVMHRDVTPEHLRIGCINYRVRSYACNITLPYVYGSGKRMAASKTLPDGFHISDIYDALFKGTPFQV